MAHAILRGANGRRHEVDFGEAEITIEVYAGDTTIEIVIEAPNDLFDRKRFPLLNLPREQFSAALDKVGDVVPGLNRHRRECDSGDSISLIDPRVRQERYRCNVKRRYVPSSAASS